MSDTKDQNAPVTEGGEESVQDHRKPLKRTRSTEEDGKDIENPEIATDEKLATKKAKTVKNAKQDGKIAEIQKSEDKSVEKPKHVFGSSTAFGSGFGLSKKTSEGSSGQEKGDKNASPKPFAFGSGLSFGGGFGVLKKAEDKAPDRKVDDSKDKEETPISDDKKEKTQELEATPSSADNSGVKLQKQEVKSGEEAEETIFQVNAKAYQLSDLKAGWKERGVGVIKVNKDTTTGKSRLVMRSRGLLKVILNLPLIKGFKIQQGFPGSLQSEKFVRITTVDDNKAPLQYAVKTGKEETVQELYEKIVDLVPK